MSDNFSVNKPKVAVAMSGGVDSSVAAALLMEQGYDVTGIYMENREERGGARSAEEIAERLGIKLQVYNVRQQFKREIIDDFINEYRNGRTPNPCIRCNQRIKFGLLLRKAKELGAAYLATGHYARIKSPHPLTPSLPAGRQGPSGRGGTKDLLGGGEGCYHLLKGKDPKKDQSYVLYRLTQDQLARVMFPLGELTKEQVRVKAKELGLAAADKAESQEICFIEDDDYGRFIREQAPEMVQPGDIIDTSGKVVGQHDGIAFYTIGQRKGIGHHHGEPKYVVGLDREKNAVIIGDDSETLKSELLAEDLSFVSGQEPTGPMEITAKIRYNSPEAAATLMPDGKVVFQQPQRAVTPGQSIVFYLPAGRHGQGEEVLGGGLIT